MHYASQQKGHDNLAQFKRKEVVIVYNKPANVLAAHTPWILVCLNYADTKKTMM